MSDLPTIQRPATAVGAVVAAAVLTALLSACGSDASGRKPAMSSYETAQHDRCVALLRPMLNGEPVRSTSIERGSDGLDYVWVNAHVHDDEDDLERRMAKGSTIGGHCQFDAGGEEVHLHTYALSGETAGDAPVSNYRFVALSRDVVATADER